jgi:AraC family transcriptional regulator of adaptative response / DNA-3-methyladenine glycosylase II
MLTDDARYDALAARDPRFDGVFFVGVSTTGIYCRPICPARTPGRSRCAFFGSPAVAEKAGFRACFRCRPELAPGGSMATRTTTPRRAADTIAEVDAIDSLVAAVVARIGEGALNAASVDELADELGVTARHLRRATEARLGVSPIELAQTGRLALAKHLLQDTALPLTQIAFAAGFGSVRRFNNVFAARIGRAPSAVRRARADGDDRREATAPVTVERGLALRLDYRPPYDWARLLAFLGARAIPGVEVVDRDAATYRRVVHLDGHTGEIAIRAIVGRNALQLTASPSLLPVVMPLVAHVRRLCDLDAHPTAISRALRRDRVLAPLVAARPGLRVPGAIDPFEAAVRALLGQQVSVVAATTLAGRFAAQLGTDYAATAGLARRFPTAAEVAATTPARIARIGLPATRAAAIHTFANALATSALRLDARAATDVDRFVADATRLPGIGPWTAHYLAMRALHVPDAFPAADLGIKKALGGAGPRVAEARAEAWRPFRSYAVLHLWTALAEEQLP